MCSLEDKAKSFASYYHASIGHRRKYTHEPYILHPASVAEIVRSVPHTEEMLAAAWLHDVVEDTPAPLYEVRKVFGAKVAALVEELTDVSKPEDGNRATRKEIDRQHLAKASTEAKTIKLADLIDNSRSIVEHDPKFARVYLAEKKALLEVLKDGDSTLYGKAQEIVNENRHLISEAS